MRRSGCPAFSRTAAKEVAGNGITINTVAPGFVRTDGQCPPDTIRAARDDDDAASKFHDVSPVMGG